MSYVYVKDTLVNRRFLAVLAHLRGGTDRFRPLVRSPCLIPWHLHFWLSCKIGTLSHAFEHELKHVGAAANTN